MIYQEFINKNKEVQLNLLEYLDQNDSNDTNFENLIKSIKDLKIEESKQEMDLFIKLILTIANNHHRTANFFNKIDQIIKILLNSIKIHFSEYEIFNIFKENKRILLFLSEEKIIDLHNYISIEHYYPEYSKLYDFDVIEYHQYLISPLKIEGGKIIKADPESIEEFKKNQKNGENETYICELIRNDLIDEFIIYINKTNLDLNSTIEKSIFETNSFLKLFSPITSLIEYAAFHGSIQIFNYLRSNKAEIKSSIWMYAIHGRNAEIIQQLEELHIEPNDKSFLKCLFESIKCHHNEIEKYIKDNLINPKYLRSWYNIKEEENKCAFQYYNYEIFAVDLNLKNIYRFASQFNYLKLFKNLYNNKETNLQKQNYWIAAKSNSIEIVQFLLSHNSGISPQCFFECSGLYEIVIPSSITFIGREAFYKCENLRKVVLPSTIKSIEEGTFRECHSLVDINIPSSVTAINDNAFRNCKYLSHIEIPSSVSFIGKGAFYKCDSLDRKDIPSSFHQLAFEPTPDKNLDTEDIN